MLCPMPPLYRPTMRPTSILHLATSSAYSSQTQTLHPLCKASETCGRQAWSQGWWRGASWYTAGHLPTWQQSSGFGSAGCGCGGCGGRTGWLAVEAAQRHCNSAARGSNVGMATCCKGLPHGHILQAQRLVCV